MKKISLLMMVVFWGQETIAAGEVSTEQISLEQKATLFAPSNIPLCDTQPATLDAADGPVGYLANLFNTTNYPSRWDCGYWSDFEGWFYILSDLSIFLAYLSIPFILMVIFLKKRSIPFKKHLVLFSVFILFCGFTHLIEAIIFWEPIYRFSGFVKLLTGIVSWVTVIALTQTLPVALSFKSPAELQEEIEQRKAAEQNLQHINEELDSFTYSVSHDLRAPLRAISGYSAVLQEDFADSLNDEGKQYLERIIINTSKMGELIDDLLNFSRLSRKHTEHETFSSKKMIREILDMDNTYKLVQVSEASLPELHGDRAMLGQVFQNLISNAVKYSRNQEKPLVEISGEETAMEASITIRDNGAGFDMKYAEKIFDVFQRFHEDSEFEGNGIGLALSKKIVDKHDGDITYSSELHKGSVFTVILPKKETLK